MKKYPLQCVETEKAMGIISGKWKPVILYHLLYGGTMRFSELKKSIPNIAHKMLTNQLRELVEQDIIQRIVYPQVPPKVEYSMTDYGRSLQPVIETLYEWGGVSYQAYGKQRAESVLKKPIEG